MSGETESYAIPVTVEWALWGKEPQDLEYRLLRCSDDTLSAANFDELVTRYATGTPEVLPQVTISWFEDREQGHHYIALSIHEEPEDHRLDATGREVVLTRCFCVPYATLAEGLVSYQAMYEVFRKIPLHDRHGPFATELPVMQPGIRADTSAMRAAALLVTCKPVCILGADRVSLAERLRFIDSVMSLLPYGLRCQLSASTWASSQFWEHKFRLFFSSARRPDDECEVIWGGDHRSVTQYEAEDYLNWLRGDATDQVNQLAKREAQLAAKTAPVRFKGDEVDHLLSRLYDLPTRPRPSRRRPVPVPPGPSVDERGEWAIEELLIDCADRMRSSDQVLVRSAIRRLAERRDDKTTAEQQDRYRGIIKEHRLFRPDESLDPQSRDVLYAALLRIAFEMPLNYEGYCQLEDCQGIARGQPMHPSLLRAAGQAGIGELCVKLLVLGAIGDGLKVISRDHVPLPSLIAAVTDRRLEPQHCRVIFETAVNDLLARARSQRLDEQLLRSALAEQAYLALVVQRIYPEPGDRLAELCKLLRLAYKETLDRSAIHTVLWTIDRIPTYDLFFAVVAMSDPEDAEFAERTFIRKLTRRYNANTGSDFLQQFPPRGQHADGDNGSHPASAGARGPRRLRQRIAPRNQARRGGSHAMQYLPATQVPSIRQETDQAAPGPRNSQKDNWVRLIIVVVIPFFLAFLVVILVHLRSL